MTERTDVVAELRPARRSLPRGDILEDVLDTLADAGQLTRASLPKKGWTMRCEGLGLPSGTVAGLLDEVRGDRA